MRGALVTVLLAASLVLHAVARADLEMVQPVPDVAGAQSTGRQLLQDAGSYGGYGYGYYGYSQYGYGYGGNGRRRLMESGGYGSAGYGYGDYGYGGYGYGYGRRLIEEQLLLEPADLLLEYAEQQQTAASGAQQLDEEQQHQGLSAAAAAAIQHAHRKPSRWNVPAGSATATEPGLPCEWLDKLYAPMKGPAHSLPHEQDISAFLHEDCTPQPPCACAGLKLDGSDAGASRLPDHTAAAATAAVN
ncbi:hypothetical protein COO60DRAFT_1518459 [Scenedesmus sp. NREL 46B-D3]|nr:hypothetical protein COO60DRAFT_1518459 [Scenedesmus sp. NREL 46B-D3]